MISTTRPTLTSPADRLRTVLGANAATSLVSGLLASVAPGFVAEMMDLDAVTWTRLVGIGLVVFAVEVALIAKRSTDEKLPGLTGLISMADAAWVVATIVVIALVDMSITGRILSLLVGVVVATFAVLQTRLRSAMTNDA